MFMTFVLYLFVTKLSNKLESLVLVSPIIVSWFWQTDMLGILITCTSKLITLKTPHCRGLSSHIKIMWHCMVLAIIPILLGYRDSRTVRRTVLHLVRWGFFCCCFGWQQDGWSWLSMQISSHEQRNPLSTGKENYPWRWSRAFECWTQLIVTLASLISLIRW